MTQSLHDSIERIRELSPQLNAATDEASRVVAAVEKFLNDDCKVGIPVSVIAEYASKETDLAAMTLGYYRVQGRYRIAVGINEEVESEEGSKTDAWTITPWSECDRGTKLTSLRVLPELLDAVAKEVESKIVSASATTDGIRSIMDALGDVPSPVRAPLLVESASRVRGIRINQLAKELNVDSKEVLAKLHAEGLGDTAANPMSVLHAGLATTVREWFRAEGGR